MVNISRLYHERGRGLWRRSVWDCSWGPVKNWPKWIYLVRGGGRGEATNHVYKFLWRWPGLGMACRETPRIRKYWTRPKLRPGRQTCSIQVSERSFSSLSLLDRVEGNRRNIADGVKDAQDWTRILERIVYAVRTASGSRPWLENGVDDGTGRGIAIKCTSQSSNFTSNHLLLPPNLDSSVFV